MPVLGKTDCFNLYAVLFEAVPGMEWLDGTNVLSEDNPNIIATAEIPDRKAEADWRQFSVPFKYRAGKSIDYDKLKAGRYSLSVVMSSSQDGDYFAEYRQHAYGRRAFDNMRIRKMIKEKDWRKHYIRQYGGVAAICAIPATAFGRVGQ